MAMFIRGQLLENGYTVIPSLKNPDISKLRQAHRVHLSKFGVISVKSRPFTANVVCEHAAKYWHKSNDEDILLYVIFVVGLLSINFASANSDSISLRTDKRGEKQTVKRTYQLQYWPGKSALVVSVFMNPIIAILSRLLVRVPQNGFLIWDVVNNKSGFCEIDPTRALTSKIKCNDARTTIRHRNFSRRYSFVFGTFYEERLSLQLYCSLGPRDEYVMQRVQMLGPIAYANACEADNDCAPEDLPRFFSEGEYLNEASRLMEEKKILSVAGTYSRFSSEVAKISLNEGEELDSS